MAQYSFNPYPDIPRGKSLPPNAAMKKAMMGTGKTLEDSKSSSPFHGLTSTSATLGGMGKSDGLAGRQGEEVRKGQDPYMPRDIFSRFSCQPGQTELTSHGMTLTKALPAGSIGFEQEKYADFVALKASGTLGAWQLKNNTFKL